MYLKGNRVSVITAVFLNKNFCILMRKMGGKFWKSRVEAGVFSGVLCCSKQRKSEVRLLCIQVI